MVSRGQVGGDVGGEVVCVRVVECGSWSGWRSGWRSGSTALGVGRLGSWVGQRGVRCGEQGKAGQRPEPHGPFCLYLEVRGVK